MISHEGREKYTALRDVISRKAKKTFSFPGTKAETRHKEEFWALKNIDFSIERGDRVGIIGRNGAGKSTLLKILSRITEPTTGHIKIKGRVASLLEVGTGFHPELTGRENIFLNGAILGMSHSEIRKHFDEIVSFAEIEKFLDTPVKRYSSGMYVRLAFAVAAHMEPEILVVDEVLAVGDAQFQKKCLGKMEEVSNNQGRTVLFVSHNMGVVAQLCSRGILLSQGQIKMNDDIRKVVERYLISDEVKNLYKRDDPGQKKNYFSSIEVINSKKEASADFNFDDQVTLRFSFRVTEPAIGLQVGIGLDNKFNMRVFTVLKEISYFGSGQDQFYHGEVTLPASIIAPNSYSFVFALWTRSGKVYDSVPGVCPIRIHDTGTDMALYEGVEYGNIIVSPEWRSS